MNLYSIVNSKPKFIDSHQISIKVPAYRQFINILYYLSVHIECLVKRHQPIKIILNIISTFLIILSDIFIRNTLQYFNTLQQQKIIVNGVM